MNDPDMWDRYADAVREAAMESEDARRKRLQAARDTYEQSRNEQAYRAHMRNDLDTRDLYLTPASWTGSHTARMLSELRELEQKHRELTDFLRLYSRRIYWRDNILMRLQAVVMRQYLMLLKARIKRG